VKQIFIGLPFVGFILFVMWIVFKFPIIGWILFYIFIALIALFVSWVLGFLLQEIWKGFTKQAWIEYEKNRTETKN
jgi:hypothetical protein